MAKLITIIITTAKTTTIKVIVTTIAKDCFSRVVCPSLSYS